MWVWATSDREFLLYQSWRCGHRFNPFYYQSSCISPLFYVLFSFPFPPHTPLPYLIPFFSVLPSALVPLVLYQSWCCGCRLILFITSRPMYYAPFFIFLYFCFFSILPFPLSLSPFSLHLLWHDSLLFCR
jgi:hypothetical protein